MSQNLSNDEDAVGVLSFTLRSQVDADVRKTLLSHYNNESVHIDNRLPNIQLTTADWETIASVEFSENEISPFHHGEVSLSRRNHIGSQLRPPSCRAYDASPLSFELLNDFLDLALLADPQTKRRPYPSGGGLYSIDTLLVALPSRLSDSPLQSGVYHVRPVSATLQPLVYYDENLLKKQLLQGVTSAKKTPHFALIYCVQLSKAIFKYRYRGYRNAVIEVGLIGQKTTEVAQALGLGTCLWGTFSEHRIRKTLQLDPLEHLPLMMQLFGRPHDEA